MKSKKTDHRKIKLTIIDPYDPLGEKIGGAETCLKGLVKYAPKTFDIYFIGITTDRHHRPAKKWTRIKIGNRKIYFFPLFYEKDENKKTKIPLSLRFVISFVLHRPTIRRSCLFFNRIESALPFMKNKFPKILNVHNDIQKQMWQKKGEVAWSKFSKAYFLFEKIILPSIDYIYTESANTVSYFISTYSGFKHKVFFLPTSVDPEIYSPGHVSKAVIRKKIKAMHCMRLTKEKWVLFVGRIQKQKDPFRLIDSFNLYQGNNGNASLIIIGDGDMKEAIASYIDHSPFADDIFLLGNIDQLNMADYYRSADVLLLTSDYEGMPLCVLEALGCGIPIVSTDAGEVKQIIKNGYSGEISKTFESKDISAALQNVLEKPAIHTEANCADAVSGYKTEYVMKPLFKRMADTYTAFSAADNQMA